MSIISFIKRVCVQTAVYWGNPQPDGFGGYTFDEPIEIKCRWDEKIRTFTNPKGKEETSKATVLLTQKIDHEGWLFLGTLQDVYGLIDADSSNITVNPKEVPGAYEIIATDETPLFRSTTKFVHECYLGFKNLNN